MTKINEPLIPDDLQNRGGIALTQLAAQGEGIESISEPGDTAGAVPIKQQAIMSNAMIEAIDRLCAKPIGFNPTAGKPAAEVLEIMARTYEGMPEMGPTGDLDPEVITWMYANQNADAHVRYALRLMPSPGRWIAKWHPQFRLRHLAPVPVVYKATIVHQDSAPSIPVSPAIAALRAELAELREMIKQQSEDSAAKKIQAEEDAEAAKLRAEIQEIKNMLTGGKTADVPAHPAPTRRPRKPSTITVA